MGKPISNVILDIFLPIMVVALVSRAVSGSPCTRYAHQITSRQEIEPAFPAHRKSRASARTIPFSSSRTARDPSSPDASSSPGRKSVEFDLACPICFLTHFPVTQTGEGRPVANLNCPRCQRRFTASLTSIDLTVTAGVDQVAYRQNAWGGTELFRNPLVSLAYERGWRQSFAWAGFPGVDREYELAMDYLRPVAAGKVLVDMSCGSGLFSRRFLASGAFSGVIAADYSESMLREARQYFDQDITLDPTRYVLLRADVARMPFQSSSVAALHAGAAIHCWPNPQASLAEISRVLQPGGVFVASTFLSAAAQLGEVLGDDRNLVLRPLRQLESAALLNANYRFWEEDELRDLCASVGLIDFRRHRRNRFIMFCASKPTM